jgi:hypothetical protein
MRFHTFALSEVVDELAKELEKNSDKSICQLHDWLSELQMLRSIAEDNEIKMGPWRAGKYRYIEKQP